MPTPEFGSAPSGVTETATVLSITDGDTIRVDRGFGSEPVRYIGIDTPEVGDPGSSEATAENARLLEGMQVVLEKDVSETDSFDRLLRYIWVGTGGGWLLVNLELVVAALRMPGRIHPTFDTASCSWRQSGRLSQGRLESGPHRRSPRFHRNRPTNLRSRMRPRTAIHPTIRACRSSPTSTALTCARWGPIL